MFIKCIQLSHGPDVIAELKCSPHTNSGQWYVNGFLVTNEKEIAQLYHYLSGEHTGYLHFRGTSYDDVNIRVIF